MRERVCACRRDSGCRQRHRLRAIDAHHPPQGGKLCIVGHTHGGEGSGGTKNIALIGAINAFVVTTVDEYGSDWAKWSKAASKSVKYTKTADGWTAHAEARPCK